MRQGTIYFGLYRKKFLTAMKSLETGEWDFPSEVKVYFLLQSMWVVNSSVFPFFIILRYASYPFVVKL